MPLSRKPFPIGLMAQTTAWSIMVRYLCDLKFPNGDPKNVARVEGNWFRCKCGASRSSSCRPEQVLRISMGKTILKLPYEQSVIVDSAFHDSYIDETIRIKAPSKSAFFEERRMDRPVRRKKTEFITRLNAKGIHFLKIKRRPFR